MAEYGGSSATRDEIQYYEDELRDIYLGTAQFPAGDFALQGQAPPGADLA